MRKLFVPGMGLRSHTTRMAVLLITTMFGLLLFIFAWTGRDIEPLVRYLTGGWTVIAGLAVGATEMTNAVEAARKPKATEDAA